MKVYKKSLLTLGILSALSLPVFAKQVLTVCTEANPEGFDYALYHANSTADASAEAMYNRLVEFVPGTTTLEPALAKKWDVSEDGKTYTFHLRDDVKFHTTKWFTPTRNMNADDVILSIQRQIDPNNYWHKQAKKGWFYSDSMQFPKLIKSIKKLDAHTVVFELNYAEAPFLSNMAMDFTSIISKEYADSLQAKNTPMDMDTKPVGTGPFQLQHFQKDAMVRYLPHPDYFRGKVKSDTLVFSIAPDPSVRLQKLRKGECQIALYPLPQDWASIEKDPALRLEKGDGLITAYIALNADKKPFDNPKVRMALSLATDRAAIIKAVNSGAAEPAYTIFPRSQWGFNKNLKPYPLDLEKARALLKEAGLENGFEMSIWTRPGTSGANPNPKLTAELLQADWKKIGVDVKVQVIEWGELLTRAHAGEHESLVLGWASDNGDPDNFISPTLTCSAVELGGNFSHWCNPEFDALIQKARETSDLAERAKYYEQAQEIVHNEAPWLTLMHPVSGVAVRQNVTGYKVSPLTLNNFQHVELKDK